MTLELSLIHIYTMSVLRALDMLDYLESCQENVGVTEVGQVLGVHKSTASRLLGTLESKGYVQRDNATGKYSLGMRVVELARSKLDRICLLYTSRCV